MSIVPENTNEKRGIQPVIALKANGGKRAEVSMDETVFLSAVIEVPDKQGSIVSVAWDLNGSGGFSTEEKLSEISREKMTVTRIHSFSEPGTYFIASGPFPSAMGMRIHLLPVSKTWIVLE